MKTKFFEIFDSFYIFWDWKIVWLSDSPIVILIIIQDERSISKKFSEFRNLCYYDYSQQIIIGDPSIIKSWSDNPNYSLETKISAQIVKKTLFLKNFFKNMEAQNLHTVPHLKFINKV